jgi:hypothetical protein
MQFLEFTGTLVSVAAIGLGFVWIILIVSGFSSDTNRLFLVNTFRLDYRVHADPPLPGDIGHEGRTLAWKLPADSAPVNSSMYESLEGIYTMDLLGSFHWGLVAVVGLWLLCSIAVFTLYLMNDVGTRLSSAGKPLEPWWFARAGPLFTWVALAWDVGAFIFIFVVTWRLSTDSTNQQAKQGVPMTTQTLLVTCPFVIAAIIYFLRELKERYYQSAGPLAPASTPAASAYASAPSRRGYSLIGYPIRAPPSQQPLVVSSRNQYTPILCIAWADGWSLVDALLLTGVVGASQNVVTHELVAVFLVAVYATFAHSAIVRLLLDAYVNEVPKEDQAYAATYADNQFRARRSRGQDGLQASAERDLFHVRVIAFLANFSAICFAFAPCYFLLLRYGPVTSFAGPFVVSYAVLTIAVPPVFWLFGNLWMELMPLAFITFRTACLIEFIYGLIVRLLFVALLLWDVAPLLVTANSDLDTYVRLWTGSAR